MTPRPRPRRVARFVKPAAAPVKAAPVKKPSRLGIPLEKQIHAQIVYMLRKRGWVVWEMQLGSERGGVVYCTKGIPDLWVVKAGRAHWLEVKRPKLGRVGKDQKKRHAEAAAHGHPVAVVHSIEEAYAAVGEA